MEQTPPREGTGNLAAVSGQLAQRVFVIFENRLQLLLVEVQEERERILRTMWLALAAAVFGLLAGVTFTFLLVLALWNYSPVLALLGLTVVYAGAVVFLFTRLNRLQKDWTTLPATLEQLRKDREWLEKQAD